MTIDDAIEHAKEVASTMDCKCADEHIQIANWLLELKILRVKNKQLEEQVHKMKMCENCEHSYYDSCHHPKRDEKDFSCSEYAAWEPKQ